MQSYNQKVTFQKEDKNQKDKNKSRSSSSHCLMLGYDQELAAPGREAQ
jgi:hypothetical protein